MHTTTPSPGARRRTPSTGVVAATWVAGTGAFLLVAAAAVFVAVHWDRLPEAAKLAVVGALTGGFLAGGRQLRRSLPATGDVLFHLGAFLLPVDVAGLGLRASAGWRAILVSEGVLGAGVLGTLAAVSGSVVLAWAATAGVVVLALGVAAVSPLPVVALVAAAAVAAHVAGWRRPALAWSALAVLGPVLGAAATAVVAGGAAPGAGVLGAMGVEGGAVALLGCLAAAVVLGREARGRGDVALAALAVTGAVAGLATTWAGAGIPGRTTLLALPAAFLAVEVVAALCRRDPFWRPLAAGAATTVELAAGVVGGFWTLGLVLVAPLVETGLDLLSDEPGWTASPADGAALAVLGAAWLVACARRARPRALGEQPGLASTARRVLGRPLAAPLAALAAVAAVEVGTASAAATAAALLVAGSGLAWSGRSVALVGGAALGFWAPVTMASEPRLSWVAGVAGAAVATLAATSGARATLAGRCRARLLALVAVAAAAAGTALSAPVVGDAAAFTAFVLQAWLVAAVLEPVDDLAGHVARTSMLAAVGAALAGPAGTAIAPAAVTTALLAGDGVRLASPGPGIGAAVSLQALVVALAAVMGFDPAGAGLALVLGAVVWGGLAAVVDGAWRVPFAAAAGMGIAAGVALASTDPLALAHALVVSGGLVVAAGVLRDDLAVAHAGGVAATVGILGHLDAASVTALELYVAPVAVQLVAAGWVARARRVPPLGSWVAYGPAVALLGGSALAERLAGGSGWHAVVAGAVGVAAVAAGGWRRLAGPLLLGTALVVAVTVVESLGALAGVPTWGWLAAGGSVLLAVGVALERADASPGEAGRRLVDVIADRFD